MISLTKFSVYFSLIHMCFCVNETKQAKRDMNDEYCGNYDYNLQDEANNTVDINSLIFPVPEHFNPRYGVEAPEIELPDDSLADSDLRDHDFMDSLMYVYYGANVKASVNYGAEIIIIGSGLSCILELLTIISASLRGKRKLHKDTKLMFFHLMSCFLISNLVFIFNNIYITKGPLQCKFISFTLYYLHIATACSLFGYSYWIVKKLSFKFPKLKFILSFVHISALLSYLISFLSSPTQSYETQRFCFISIQKETIIDYILPIFILILSTTFFSLNGIRKINGKLSDLECDYPDCQIKYVESEMSDLIRESRVSTLKEYKKLLKILCVIQCSYESVWFIGMLAMENLEESNGAAVTYCITSFLMNLYIFWKLKLFLPTDDENVHYEDITEAEKTAHISSESLLADDIPLLINVENGIEIAKLNTEHVQTLSS